MLKRSLPFALVSMYLLAAPAVITGQLIAGLKTVADRAAAVKISDPETRGYLLRIYAGVLEMSNLLANREMIPSERGMQLRQIAETLRFTRAGSGPESLALERAIEDFNQLVPMSSAQSKALDISDPDILASAKLSSQVRNNIKSLMADSAPRKR